MTADGTEMPEYSDIAPPSIAGTPQRMWASGEFEWVRENPLRVGDAVTQVTTIDNVEEKQGRERGAMFVLWQKKQISNARGVSLVERRCHVFRPPPRPSLAASVQPGPPNSSVKCSTPSNWGPLATPKLAPSEATFSAIWRPTEVLMFRYSALLYIANRVHYDLDYCRDVEKRPGGLYLVHRGHVSGVLITCLFRPRHRRSFDGV
jgi:3-methylfumaryl-CoA hydratase